MALANILMPVIVLSSLQVNAVAPAAQMTYDMAIMEFVLWLRDQQVCIVRSVRGLDAAVVSYFDMLSSMLTPFSAGEKLLAGLSHRTPNHAGSLSSKFPGASRSLKGWRRLFPARTRPPLPFFGVLLIAAQLIQQGVPQMALAALVGFSCYLRPSELTGLRVGQVVLPQNQSHRGFRQVSLVLHKFDGLTPGKTGHFDESMKLDSSWTMPWIVVQMEMLLGGRAPFEPLWNFKHADFVREYLRAARRLGLEQRQMTTAVYGLRHGGASHDTVAQLRTFQEVKERGRWATDASVFRYRKASVAQNELSKIPQAQQAIAAHIAKNVGALFVDSRERTLLLRRLQQTLAA